MADRYLMASDREGRWFIRAVASLEHDVTNDEKVYRCSRDLGGPYTFAEAVQAMQAILSDDTNGVK